MERGWWTLRLNRHIHKQDTSKKKARQLANQVNADASHLTHDGIFQPCLWSPKFPNGESKYSADNSSTDAVTCAAIETTLTSPNFQTSKKLYFNWIPISFSFYGVFLVPMNRYRALTSFRFQYISYPHFISLCFFSQLPVFQYLFPIAGFSKLFPKKGHLVKWLFIS